MDYSLQRLRGGIMSQLTHKYINRIPEREENLFLEEYYSGTDVKVYISSEHKPETEIAYISYSVSEQLKPLYGYASRTWDDVAVGNRIVTGAFKMSIKNPKEQSSYEEVILHQNIDKEKSTLEQIEEMNQKEEEAKQEQEWPDNESNEDSGNEENSDIIPMPEKLFEQGVFEFTEGKYSTLKLGDKGPFISTLRQLLDKAGINMAKYNYSDDSNYFDTGLEEAVSEFQETSMGITPTLTVDDATLNALISGANNMSDIIYSETTSLINNDTSDENSPHFDSFFTTENKKTGRKNQVDIKIVLGENSIIKIIHNVYMRSVSTEFDTSGNPISEMFEFIAQDLTESDEPNDINKY